MKIITNTFTSIFLLVCIFSWFSFTAHAANMNTKTYKRATWSKDCDKANGECILKTLYGDGKGLEEIKNVKCSGKSQIAGKEFEQDVSADYICVKKTNSDGKKLCNRCSKNWGCVRTSFYIGNKLDESGKDTGKLSSQQCDDSAEPTLDEKGDAYSKMIYDYSCPPLGPKDFSDPRDIKCKDMGGTATGCSAGESCVKTIDAKTQISTGRGCKLTEGTNVMMAFCVKPKTGSGNANNNDKNNTNACKAKNGMCLDSCNTTYPNFVSNVLDCPIANQVCCSKTTDQSRAQQAAQQGTSTQCRCQPATMVCQGRNMGMGTCGANAISCCTTVSNNPATQLAQSLGQLISRLINPSSNNSRMPTNSTGIFPTPTPYMSMSPTPTPSSGSLNNPNGVDVTFNLKINFHGITRLNGSSNNLRVKVTLVDSQATTTTKTAMQEGDFISAGAGIFTGSVTFTKIVPKSGYYLLIKGPKHVQRKICSTSPSENYPGEYTCNDLLTVSPGVNDIDASRIYMLVGDVPMQDGIVNSADFGNVRVRLGRSDYSSLEVADLNLDGIVNGQDYSLITQTLQTTGGIDQR